MRFNNIVARIAIANQIDTHLMNMSTKNRLIALILFLRIKFTIIPIA